MGIHDAGVARGEKCNERGMAAGHPIVNALDMAVAPVLKHGWLPRWNSLRCGDQLLAETVRDRRLDLLSCELAVIDFPVHR
jgi:hypothetical protein